jgi:adenylate kinase
MRLVFIGPPGAGKGTQSEKLLGYLKIPHLSTGNMLREAIEQQTAGGLLVEQYMSEGQLVPDPIILQMVEERLEQPDCASGVLFDGFPRTLTQASALDEFLAKNGSPLDLVLELRVSDAEVIRRLTQRSRRDDQPRIVAERLKSYWKQTRPVLEYYSQQDLLEGIDGTGTPDAVFERIKRALHRHTGQGPATGLP